MKSRRAGEAKAAKAKVAPADASARRLRASILRWYLKHRRDLPWRRSRDPYAIWISEIMLQQTRVETVIPYYERFLARFPDARSLAGATEAEVLAAWSGLGYYSRARNLREAAGLLVREHGGNVPNDDEALKRLPGIGDYTAGAIASVAFDRAAAAVDGNVIRVLARIHGYRGKRSAPALRRLVLQRAEVLAPGPRPGDWTQALMELGATVCLPREPRCGICPAKVRCEARASGTPDRYPEPAAKAVPKRGRRVMLLARQRDRVYLVPDRSPEGGGAWALPTSALVGRGARAAGRGARAAGALAQRLGFPAPSQGPATRFRHRTFSLDLEFEVWESGPLETRRGGAGAGGKWVRPADLAGLPMRSPTLKAFNKLRVKR